MQTPAYKERLTCRICENEILEDVLSLGPLHISGFPEEDVHSLPSAPLNLVRCDARSGGCGLVQLRHSVNQDTMYREYWYRSGVNKSMYDELNAIARRAEASTNLSEGDLVLDIGANDGTLLRAYTTKGIIRTGFDPAKNLLRHSSLGTGKIICDYFSAHTFFDHFPAKKAKIITAIAMFYDLEDPNSFVRDIAEILAQDGIFIIQMSYLPSMLSQNAFDNICHEHLEYYSLKTLENLLERHGLRVCDVELNDVNGGSFRVYVRHSKIAKKFGESVKRLRAEEMELGLDTFDPYNNFAYRVGALKENVVNFIKAEVGADKRVHVYGASTKGNTLLQYFGLDESLIEAAAERNPIKWGRRTVATNIPIISEVESRAEKPDYYLVLPWHFINEFLERESEFLARGGKFIVPLPEFKIIGVGGIELFPIKGDLVHDLHGSAPAGLDITEKPTFP